MLGVNVLPSLLHYIDAPEWKDEVDELGANIGTFLSSCIPFQHTFSIITALNTPYPLNIPTQPTLSILPLYLRTYTIIYAPPQAQYHPSQPLDYHCSQYTLPTQYTHSIYPLNIPSQPTLSILPLYLRTYTIIYAPPQAQYHPSQPLHYHCSQYTLPSHLNPPSQCSPSINPHTLFTHHHRRSIIHHSHLIRQREIHFLHFLLIRESFRASRVCPVLL